MSVRGQFITLEGIEGVGKSTQAKRLAEALRAAGHEVVCTREPGGAPLAEAVRDLLKHSPPDAVTPIAELLLIFAARAAHADALLRPALAAGKWVVCDRFVDASLAYQGGGRGLGQERVEALAAWIVPDLVPDLTLLLDLPLEQAFERLDRRGERDRFERENTTFFTRVRKAYLELAMREPSRVHIVDAADDEATVAARCHALVREKLQV